MNNILSLLFLISILLFSCTTKQQEDTTITTFQLNPTQRNIVQGNKGGILIIPANCFVDEQGNAVKETIDLQLTEAYQLQDILEYDLQTVANDQLLITGGMINLKATAANKSVQIASNKEITYQKGLANTDTNAYQFFELEDENWDNPQLPNHYLTYLPTSEHPILYCQETKDKLITSEQPVYFNELNNIYDSIHITKILKLYHRFIPVYSDDDSSNFEKILDNSFLSSEEYLQRLRILPLCGETNSHIHLAYINNIDKPLWVADSLAIEEVKKHMGYYLKDTTDSEPVPPYYYLQLKLLTAFKNQRKTTFHEDRMTVEERAKLQAFYKKMRTEETKRTNLYSFSIRGTGWHNIDYYYNKLPLQPTQLQVVANQTIEKSLLVLKDVPVVVYGTKETDGSFIFNKNLPQTAAYLITIGFEGEQILLSKKEIIISQNETEPINLTPHTKAEMEQVLQQIEQDFDVAN